MADKSFEAELERRFAETPTFADAERFSHRVSAALDRDWGMRRLVIGALGLAGGLIGGLEFIHSGLAGQVNAVGATWRVLVSDAVRLPAAREVNEWLSGGVNLDGEVLAMSGALALLAIALFVTRAIREL